MRQFKFRIWNKKNNELLGGSSLLLLDSSDGAIFNSILNDYEPDLIPMQFTGLKDKNGKEIYEGDIIRVSESGRAPITIGNVSYQESFAGFAYSDDVWNYRLSQTAEMFREIIGNLYENPELLTTTKP